MNTNRGIFDIFNKPATSPQPSPFEMADDPVPSPAEAETNPFASSSPFQIAESAAEKTAGSASQAERRIFSSPFQSSEPPEGFGFEAPVKPLSPGFDDGATPEFPPASSMVPAATSPFTEAVESAFRQRHEPVVSTPPVSEPAAAATFPLCGDFLTDSSSIRQLELRAIFGVDRELTADEILQRARSLSGVRHLSRVPEMEVASIEGLKNLLPSLGLTGPLRLHAGGAPVDFIREGGVFLAVQVDGGYAPGLRETLMIVARELGRLG